MKDQFEIDGVIFHVRSVTVGAPAERGRGPEDYCPATPANWEPDGIEFPPQASVFDLGCDSMTIIEEVTYEALQAPIEVSAMQTIAQLRKRIEDALWHVYREQVDMAVQEEYGPHAAAW